MNLAVNLAVNLNLLFETVIKSELELIGVVQNMRRIFVEQQINKTAIVLLQGDLSAGKTTLVQYLAKSYQLQQTQSPTFAIHQQYQNQNIRIDHFDLYRLETEVEIESSGFWDFFRESCDNHLIAVEWSERVPSEDWPQHLPLFVVKIEILEIGLRKISFLQRKNES